MEDESPNSFKEYRFKRSEICKSIELKKYGQLTFTPQEEELNKVFRSKISEIRSNLDPSFYRQYTLPNLYKLNQTSLFKAIDKMPKGAVLHIHLDCCYDVDWFVGLTYSPNIYLKNNRLYYRRTPPNPQEYQSFAQLREESRNFEQFDDLLKKSIQIDYDDLVDKRSTWDIFEDKIMKVGSVILFRDNFYNHILNVARGFMKEGVFHLEAREFLNAIVDEEGNPIGIDAEMELYRSAVAEIRKECPYFTFKIIIQGLKAHSLSEIEENLKITLLTAKKYSDIIVGYDLVMEEDKYKQMIELVEVLLKKDRFEKEIGVKLPYVFHGGESIQFLENDNLFDLILLKTKRIGHGLNLVKHSYLMDSIKEKNIAIEINPLSNQILDYVYDLRLHPAITYHNFGLKIVISSDDPGLFKSNYVNYDFFACALAMEFDLKDFKRICLNSLESSLLTEVERKVAVEVWENKWKEYINNLVL